jgi:hypothetical protein
MVGPGDRRVRKGLADLVVAVGLLVVLSACSSDDASPAADSPSGQSDGDATSDAVNGVSVADGCAVISEDDVATAADVTVYGSLELPTGCQWSISGDDPLVSYEWQETVTPGFAANRDLGESDPTYEVTTIDGLGEDAYLRTTANGAGEVQTGETWVRSGDLVFFVRTVMVEWSSEVADGEVAIAELILDGLG